MVAVVFWVYMGEDWWRNNLENGSEGQKETIRSEQKWRRDRLREDKKRTNYLLLIRWVGVEGG